MPVEQSTCECLGLLERGSFECPSFLNDMPLVLRVQEVIMFMLLVCSSMFLLGSLSLPQERMVVQAGANTL